jgi:hypothetical protein
LQLNLLFIFRVLAKAVSRFAGKTFRVCLSNKIKTALREGGLFWLTYMLCQRTVTLLPSSKQKAPDLLRGSGLRTTGTRQRKWLEHIGLDFTTLAKCVNTFDITHLNENIPQIVPVWVLAFAPHRNKIHSLRNYYPSYVSDQGEHNEKE